MQSRCHKISDLGRIGPPSGMPEAVVSVSEGNLRLTALFFQAGMRRQDRADQEHAESARRINGYRGRVGAASAVEDDRERDGGQGRKGIDDLVPERIEDPD